MLKTVFCLGDNRVSCRKVVQFGEGRIGMNAKTFSDTLTDDVVGVVDLFYNPTPKTVGKRFKADSTEQYMLSLAFSNVQSVDTLIEQLQETRAKMREVELEMLERQ